MHKKKDLKLLEMLHQRTDEITSSFFQKKILGKFGFGCWVFGEPNVAGDSSAECSNVT
jgi:hypothetical protein